MFSNSTFSNKEIKSLTLKELEESIEQIDPGGVLRQELDLLTAFRKLGNKEKKLLINLAKSPYFKSPKLTSF